MKSQIPVAKGFEQVCMLFFFICMHTRGGGGDLETYRTLEALDMLTHTHQTHFIIL